MHTEQEPVVNAWYTNLSGDLFKVKAALYGNNGLSSIVIIYLDGRREIITRQDWYCLRLMKHTNNLENTVDSDDIQPLSN
ncbi:MAG: hypothetical protein OEZ58_11860 [Gammaproteobacteria bacterium]|nr:hypothetical protein [Gammaproteobacteria bacterium]